MGKNSGPLLILLIAAFSCATLRAQTIPVDIFQQLESVKPGQGRVKIFQDPSIRTLVNLHISQQKRINGIRGYRISIYMGSGQEANKQADQSRARFISRYEEVKSYKKFEYPYFKVYVGDFRTKSEALRFLKKMENDYPNAFIREDIVSFPD
jgi:hypothetical protein